MKERIREWLELNRENLGLKNSDFELEEMTNGESNHVFKMVLEDEAFVELPKETVIRTSFDISEDRISHAAKILDLLEKAEVNDVPRKVYLEFSNLLDQPVLVETYVGDKNIHFSEMNDKQLEEFASKMAEIHSMTPERFNEVFDRNEPESASMKKELGDNFEKFSNKPFMKYRELVSDADPRIEKMFEKQKKLYNEMVQVKGELPWRMTHGDPANNVRASRNDIFIIDWEYARPGVPRFELVYTFRHNNVDIDERERFMEIYSKYRKPSKIAEKYADRWEKFLAFNDMIWAAKRKEKVKEIGEDPSKYERMFEERMKQLEKLWR